MLRLIFNTTFPSLDLASAAPLPTTAGSGGLDGAFLLARPGGSSAGAALPPALLAPLGADGWILVEVEDDAAAQWGALAPALECLGVALTVAGRERAAGQRAQGTFRRLLREVSRLNRRMFLSILYHNHKRNNTHTIHNPAHRSGSRWARYGPSGSCSCGGSRRRTRRASIRS